MILLYNISFQHLEMEEPAGSLEVDALELMEKRLPRYVMNCLQAAGYDDLEAIASMDVAEGEKSNCISMVEEHIERHHKRCVIPVAYQNL